MRYRQRQSVHFLFILSITWTERDVVQHTRSVIFLGCLQRLAQFKKCLNLKLGNKQNKKCFRNINAPQNEIFRFSWQKKMKIERHHNNSVNDWMFVECFTPYRQYFSHITAAICKWVRVLWLLYRGYDPDNRSVRLSNVSEWELLAFSFLRNIVNSIHIFTSLIYSQNSSHRYFSIILSLCLSCESIVANICLVGVIWGWVRRYNGLTHEKERVKVYLSMCMHWYYLISID